MPMMMNKTWQALVTQVSILLSRSVTIFSRLAWSRRDLDTSHGLGGAVLFASGEIICSIAVSFTIRFLLFFRAICITPKIIVLWVL